MQNYQTKIFFTTKADGNLAFHVGDDKKIVLTNHQKLSKKLHYNIDLLVHMKQIHSDIVHTVDDNDNFSNPPTCDALITNKKNIPLMVMVADCTPIIFSDEINGVIGVAHVGRQGAFKNIIKNTIDAMHTQFDSDAKNIKVSIGAGIGECCYEVGKEISLEAKALNLDYAIKIINDSFHLNIGSIIDNQLIDNGILNKNIMKSVECSCCTKETFYSYRANPKTGRFAGVVYLK